MNEVIKVYDCSILCGFRRKEEQDEAFNNGKSKVQWPNSKHNVLPSNAVDVAPYPVAWFGTNRFFFLAGLIKGIGWMKGYSVVWGADWDDNGDFTDQTFNDYGHFEVE